MDEVELETAVDDLILKSGLDLWSVTGVLESMVMRYREQAAAGDEEE